MIYYVSSLIKPCSLDDEELIHCRKRILGNNHINIFWMENPSGVFDSSLLLSSVTLIFILLYPINSTYILIKIKENKFAKYKILDKVLAIFPSEIIVDFYFGLKYIQHIAVHINSIIEYELQKEAYIHIAKESNGHRVEFTSNISQRFREIDRAIFKFKQSTK